MTSVRWASAARLAGAFAQSGCQVDALFPEGHALAKSRYPEKRFAYRPLQPLKALADAVAKSKPDLVIPCDDRAAAQLRRLNGESDLLASRSGFVTAAREAGIAAPETVSIPDEATFDFALRLIGLPAVLKADGSWGGDGVAVVHTIAEAKAAWQRLSARPSLFRRVLRAIRRGDPHHLTAVTPSLCLQRFIPGRPATTSFACWRGEVVAANHFDVLVTNGASGPASVVRRLDDPAMQDAAERLAHRFDLSGLHGLDYVRDEHGKPHLIEINPRATQTSHLSFGPGHDLCAALAQRLGAEDPGRRAVAGDAVALFPQERTRDRNSPWLRAAHHDVPWDDPRVLDACLGAS
ncbi:MAG TPA: ATP-grasp domain-containing protein [Rhizomicrobium sp.]